MTSTRQTWQTLIGGCHLIIIFLLPYGRPALAQSQLPVIKATSKTVDIRDGSHFKREYWAIMPERKPDYYFVELPQKDHRVSFITDLDSISMDVTYGKDYDFIILLDGKDSSYTRVSARYKNLNAPTRKNALAGPDTIPFTLGDNHKVYVKAKLNGANVSNIQLDLGAGGVIINKTSLNKVKMNFDGKVNLANSDGVNQVPSASKNLLQIGNLAWDSVPIAVAGNMKIGEDLIISNSLFLDKMLEINYDKQILVVYDSLPPYATDYSRHDLILDGGILPYIKVSLAIRNKKQTGWAMFDTGARTTILNNADVPLTYRVLTELATMIGLDDAVIPRLGIGNYQLSGFEYKTRDMGDGELRMILGNDLLKRFNLIFDNRNGYLYMQPNSLTTAAYGKRDEYYVVRAVVATLILIILILIIKKAGKKKTSYLKYGFNNEVS